MLNYLNSREIHDNLTGDTHSDQFELLSSRSADKHTIAQTPTNTRVTYLIKLNSNSELLAAAHGNHSIGIYQASSGRLLAVCQGHLKSPWTLTFHPSDPYKLASGCLDGSLKIWNLQVLADLVDEPVGDPVLIRATESWQHFGAISSVDFHPTRHILVVVHTFDIVFYDLNSKKPVTVWRFAKNYSRVRWVKFNNTGNALYTATANQVIEKKTDRKYPEVTKKVKRENVLKHILSDLKTLDGLKFCSSCLIKVLIWASCLASPSYLSGIMDLRLAFEHLSQCIRSDKELYKIGDLLKTFTQNEENSSSNVNPSSVIILEELNKQFKRIEEMNRNERFFLWTHRQLMRFSLCRCCLDNIWNYINSFIDWGFDAENTDPLGIVKEDILSEPYQRREKDVQLLNEFFSNSQKTTAITYSANDLFSASIISQKNSQHLPFTSSEPNHSNQYLFKGPSKSQPELEAYSKPFKRQRLSIERPESCMNLNLKKYESSSSSDFDESSQDSVASTESNIHLASTSPIDHNSIIRQFQNLETFSPNEEKPRLRDLRLDDYQELSQQATSSSMDRFSMLTSGYQRLQETLCPMKKAATRPFEERLSVSQSNEEFIFTQNIPKSLADRLTNAVAEENGTIQNNLSNSTYRVCRWELDFLEVEKESSFQDIFNPCEPTHINCIQVSYKSNALVIQNSRIYNDTSLRLSNCGKYLAALVTLNNKTSFINATDSIRPLETFVAVFSTEPSDQRGKCIYGRKFGPFNSPVCLDFSPSCRHLVVGFATQKYNLGFTESLNINPIGRIFRLNTRLSRKDEMLDDGYVIERNLSETGCIMHPSEVDCYLPYHEEDVENNLKMLQRMERHRIHFKSILNNPMSVTINSIVWKPDGGIIYGTNKGLVLLVRTSNGGTINLYAKETRSISFGSELLLENIEKNSDLVFKDDPSDEKNLNRKDIVTHESFFNSCSSHESVT